METLKEKLKKIDAYTFRNKWKAKLELTKNEYIETNNNALLELSTLHEKRNIISFDYIKKMNDLIYENTIKINELTSIINSL